MLPVIQIGHVALPTKPLILFAALYAGLWLAGREADRRGLDGERLWNAGFLGLGGGLVAGRIVYVLLHWSAYRSDPLAILSPKPGTIVPSAALAAGALVALGYLWRARSLNADAADAIALGLPLALILIDFGNLLNGDAFGVPSDVPWAIPLWGERRHPVQVYELLAIGIVLIVLWRRRQVARPGDLAWGSLLGYGLVRLIFEPFRAQSWVLTGGYHGVQILGLIAVLFALWALTRPRQPDTAV
ncbi:MAG: prolipoprotein diacylglyceryl transferase [Anaerolineae bacterium]|nr:prolipoprotein diacylglyceryl transferase [Anaerolineae bacterium]